MISSLSARLIAEEWTLMPGSRRKGPSELDLSWFYSLSHTEPDVYGRLAPKIARIVEAYERGDDAKQLELQDAVVVMRSVLQRR